MMMIMSLCSRWTKTTIGICVFMIAACFSCSCANRNSSDATGNAQSDASILVNSLTAEEMMDNIKKLGALFAEMVNNDYNYWKNIPLGHQAFLLMRDSLPLRVAGELTPYTRIVLLDKMLSCIPEVSPKLSDYAPKIISFKINPEKIGDVVCDEAVIAKHPVRTAVPNFRI